MNFFGDTYFKCRDKVKSVIIDLGLYKFAMKCYGLLLNIKYIPFDIKRRKRARGYIDPEYAKLRKYKNKHKGKRCFIVCTGPSLTVDDVNKLKGEYTFGMNSIMKLYDKTDWRATYYAVADSVVYNAVEKDPEFRKIKGKFIAGNLKSQVKDKDSVLYPFDIRGLIIDRTARSFSRNIYEVVYDGGTVTYVIMQIAAYMGFKEIYLLGCDFDFSGPKKHFTNYGFDNSKTAFNVVVGGKADAEKDKKAYVMDIESTYKLARKYAEKHGIKIYNATRGGKLEVYERVDFDSLFEDKK